MAPAEVGAVEHAFHDGRGRRNGLVGSSLLFLSPSHHFLCQTCLRGVDLQFLSSTWKTFLATFIFKRKATMFETTFSYASATPIPSALVDEIAGLNILHDFETVVKLSPDCRGCKPVQPPNGKNGYINGTKEPKMQYFEVEDDLPFIPKKLWSGGVRYTADFVPVEDGCDITIHAPAGFTSTNHWRLLRETAPLNETIHEDEADRDQPPSQLERTGTRDMHHTESQGAGWYVQIISDAKCPRMYAGFVKGTLRNQHSQLQHAFIDRLEHLSKEMAQKTNGDGQQQRSRRPTLGRRRSTNF
ncbi:uncharacterized protein LTR77_009797 [Saxophila tyrrhenica]|uniref:DUF7053 domain-containing protein n=1 Tax=Saxophila tyrrhenica TaxID=1690608 RepID=A0AAV9NXI9_9PEZI|nr:hypothetical protein LTR77_009797 [Saxophila tyrrhenica]